MEESDQPFVAYGAEEEVDGVEEELQTHQPALKERSTGGSFACCGDQNDKVTVDRRRPNALTFVVHKSLLSPLNLITCGLSALFGLTPPVEEWVFSRNGSDSSLVRFKRGVCCTSALDYGMVQGMESLTLGRGRNKVFVEFFDGSMINLLDPIGDGFEQDEDLVRHIVAEYNAFATM